MGPATTVADIRRREAQRSTGLIGPPRRNVRVDTADIGDVWAPDPVRYGDYNFEGKPIEHADSHAWIAVSTPIADWQQVSELRHGVIASKIQFHHSADRPRGHQYSWGGTPNIERPAAEIYGDLVTVQGNEDLRMMGAKIG